MTTLREKNVNNDGYTHLPRTELNDTVEPTQSCTSSGPVQRRLFNDLVIEALPTRLKSVLTLERPWRWWGGQCQFGLLSS